MKFKVDFFYHRLKNIKETSLSIFDSHLETKQSDNIMIKRGKSNRNPIKMLNVEEFVEDYVIHKRINDNKRENIEIINNKRKEFYKRGPSSRESKLDFYKEYNKIRALSPIRRKSNSLIFDNIVSSYYTRKNNSNSGSKIVDCLAMDKIFFAVNKLPLVNYLKSTSSSSHIRLKKDNLPNLNLLTKKPLKIDSYFDKLYIKIREKRNNSLPPLMILKVDSH